MASVRRWFAGGADLDREIAGRFGATLEAALAGSLDSWAATPRGRLALVIVLDQFSRSALRDRARMYAGDARAQRLALEAFDAGLDRGLDYRERLFLSMPLLHSEDAALHERLADIAASLAADAPAVYAPMLAMHAEQVAKYREVIRRFGRFPHRNALLGRVSSAEELEFLEDWESRAAPGGMRG
jgi:uncharacterized protein (DUF924 family)